MAEPTEQKETILGGKLKGGLFCHYSILKLIGQDMHDTGTIKSERPIHEDLKNAFAQLTVHLPVIIEDLKPGDIANINSSMSGEEANADTIDIISRFSVSEFVYDPEKKAVQIFGTKSLDLGILPIQTPFILLEGSDYHYALELQVAVAQLQDEIMQYIDGKQAPTYEQTDMFADEETEEVRDEEVAPKRGRGRPKGSGKKSPLVGVEITATGPDGSSVTMSGEEFEHRVAAAEDEFNQPLSAFQRKPEDVDEETL